MSKYSNNRNIGRKEFDELSVSIATDAVPTYGVRAELDDVMTLDDVYSYTVYFVDGVHKVVLMYCLDKEYNCLDRDECIDRITAAIHSYNNEQQRVVCWEQPPLEVTLEVLEPLVNKLASTEHSHWQQLEFDDLKQMCNLCICRLYKQGYRINSQLLRRSFNNEVIMSLRKDYVNQQTVSLDCLMDNDGDDGDINFVDCIEDLCATEAMTATEDAEAAAFIIKTQRDIIVDKLGQRQYDQLLLEYTSKSTTNWSRKTLHSLKQYVSDIGLDDKSFDHLK